MFQLWSFANWVVKLQTGLYTLYLVHSATMTQIPFYDKPIKTIAIITIAVFILYGLVLTCLPVFPFWIDEWLLLDNLKFKSAAQLWHGLDHTQQFPRVYLEIIKYFSAACNYSYFSLRLPSFLAHSFGLVLLYRLSRRIFPGNNLPRFLWVMIYISFSTSIHYFVQLKQYTMEMTLSLVGIWQLLELINMEARKPTRLTLCLLLLSFALCPFFSYTYPIVVAPVYLVIVLRSFKLKRWCTAIWLPLFLGIVSILACYQLDTRHVLEDKGMQDFWKDLLMKTFSARILFRNTYMMFRNLGTGDLFGNVYAILGIVAFIYSSFAAIKNGLLVPTTRTILSQYSCALLWLVLGLFIAGKLPLGTFRLNSFVVAALGFLIVNMLLQLYQNPRWKPFAVGLSLILFLANIGAIYATISELSGSEHAKKLRIYNASNRAIKEARQQGIPVLVTSGIAFPFDDRWTGDWILKTLPAYKVTDTIQVLALPGVDRIAEYTHGLPNTIHAAIVLDGDAVETVHF